MARFDILRFVRMVDLYPSKYLLQSLTAQKYCQTLVISCIVVLSTGKCALGQFISGFFVLCGCSLITTEQNYLSHTSASRRIFPMLCDFASTGDETTIASCVRIVSCCSFVIWSTIFSSPILSFLLIGEAMRAELAADRQYRLHTPRNGCNSCITRLFQDANCIGSMISQF